jgi:hypothetical protein
MANHYHVCSCKVHMRQIRYDRANAFKLRRQRASKGLCILCGIDPPEPDHKSCPKCLDIRMLKKHEKVSSDIPRISTRILTYCEPTTTTQSKLTLKSRP